MRRLYLIRHGKPDFPTAEKYCIGTTDMPISTLGRLQGALAGMELDGRIRLVFSSPLSRAVETARMISRDITVIDGLIEMNAGDWDGLSFSRIRDGWPELFDLRGLDPNIPIPGSEDIEQGQTRFINAVKSALDNSSGDVAIVAHATVIKSLICRAAGLPLNRLRDLLLDYGAYAVLDFDGDFHLSSPQSTNIHPHPALTENSCIRLLNAADCPDNVISHCLAVRDEALRIADKLTAAGLSLDRELIFSSALLHDIARTLPDHPTVGAAWMDALGYGEVADIIRQHHDPLSCEINEAGVVFIADKLIQGTDKVDLSSRFESSLKKCRDGDALKAHEKRKQAAFEIKAHINQICKKELIQ